MLAFLLVGLFMRYALILIKQKSVVGRKPTALFICEKAKVSKP